MNAGGPPTAGAAGRREAGDPVRGRQGPALALLLGLWLWAAFLSGIEVRAGVPVFGGGAITVPVAHDGTASAAVVLLQLGGAGPKDLSFREPDRLVAYAGLHFHWVHLLQAGVAASMLSLVAFRLGVGAALLVAVASAVAGGLAQALVGSAAVAVGSSAVLYGVLAAWSTAGILDRPGIRRQRIGYRAAVVLLVGGVALEIALGEEGWKAHLAGGVAGAALAAWLRRVDPAAGWLRRAGLGALLLALLAEGVALHRAFREGPAGALDRLAGVAAHTRRLDVALGAARALVEHPAAGRRHLGAARVALRRVLDGGYVPADELAGLAWREGRVEDAVGFERLVFEHAGSAGHGRRLLAYGLSPGREEARTGRDGGATAVIELVPADETAGLPRRIRVDPGGPIPCGLVAYAAVRHPGGEALGVLQVVLPAGAPPPFEWRAAPGGLREDAELVPLLVDRKPFWLPRLEPDGSAGPVLWAAGPRIPPPPPPAAGPLRRDPGLPGPREVELDPPPRARITACAPAAIREAVESGGRWKEARAPEG